MHAMHSVDFSFLLPTLCERIGEDALPPFYMKFSETEVRNEPVRSTHKVCLSVCKHQNERLR